MSYVGKVTAGGATHLVGSTLFGTCTTAATTAAKVVTLSDFDQLIDGVTVHVIFQNGNTASNPTLNINSTGARGIYINAASRAGTTVEASWGDGDLRSFTYDSVDDKWYMNDIPHISNMTASDRSTGTYTTAKYISPKVLADALGGIDSGVTGVKGNAESNYRTGQVNLTPANIGAAPVSHASSSDTYGKGTSSDYGHVKLSDATDGTSAAASGGTAATPKAVSDALAAAKSYADSSGVTGAKGAAEGTYRTGQVSLSPKNVGTMLHATCSTAAATTAKTATLDQSDTFTNTDLVTGAVVAVTFTNGNSALSPTLKVGTSTAKSIAMCDMSGSVDNASDWIGWGGGETIFFTYNGTYWIMEPSGWSVDAAADYGAQSAGENAAITTNAAYPITLAIGADGSAHTGKLNKSSNLTYNPSTKALSTGGAINGLTLTKNSTGFSVAGGTTSKTLTVTNSYTLGDACAKSIGSVADGNTGLVTGDAVYDAIQAAVTSALTYKGTVSAESSLLNTALSAGWMYIVTMPDAQTSSITIGGHVCEEGDTIIVKTAGTYTTSSALGAAIDVVQSEIDAITDGEIDTITA